MNTQRKPVYEAICALAENTVQRDSLVILTQIASQIEFTSESEMNVMLEALDDAATRLRLDDVAMQEAYEALLDKFCGIGHHHAKSYPAVTALLHTASELRLSDLHAGNKLRIIAILISNTELEVGSDLSTLHATIKQKALMLGASHERWLLEALVDLEDRMEKAEVSEVVN